MADRYGIYCGSFTHGGGTLDLRQLDDQSIDAGSRMKSVRPGGSLLPAAHILSTANPRCRFRTCDVLTVLTAMAGEFHLFCSGGHVMRYQKRTEGGAFASGGVHFTQSTAKGFLHVTELVVNIDSDEGAYMDLEYIPLSTAGENPITNTTTANYAAVVTPTFLSQYFMGGVYSGASPVLGLKSIRCRPGIAFGSNRSDGGVFPRSDASSILGYTPYLGLDFLNVAMPSTIGSLFLSVLGAAITAYFQRGTTATDGRVAAATSSHAKVAVSAGSWGADSIRVAGTDDGMVSVSVYPTVQIAPTLGVALGA